jgi:hypothetical protein
VEQAASLHQKHRHERPVLAYALVALGLLTLFLLVHNPFWVPTGDSEVFLTAARNLYRGEGLHYLSGPLRLVPPGWPMTLAGLIWIGDGRVVVLKLAQIGFMTGGLLFWLAVLRTAAYDFRPTKRSEGPRFARDDGEGEASLNRFQRRWNPQDASLAVLLTAFCSPLYPLTFWLHSDALFMLLAGAATWAAARHGTWWLLVTCLLITLGIGVRYAGVLFAVVPATIYLCRGKSGIVPAIAVLASAGLSLMLVLSLTANGVGILAERSVSVMPELIVREQPWQHYVEELWERLLRWPDWPAWTLWAPMRFLGFSGGTTGIAANAFIGCLTLGLLAGAAWHAMLRRNGLLLGVFAYIALLAIAWPFPNSRYLVPILPGLIAGVLLGISLLPKWLGHLRIVFVGALLFVNGFMFATDVWIARSPTQLDFYSRYEAGIHLELIEAADYLAGTPEPVGFSERYENLGERWNYSHAERVLAYVGDVHASAAPRKATGWSVKKMQPWGREQRLGWYVHQNPTVPGRVWHFRLTHDEHGRIMGDRPGPRAWQFALFRMKDHARPSESKPRRWVVEHATPPLRGERLREVATRVPWLDGRPTDGPTSGAYEEAE